MCAAHTNDKWYYQFCEDKGGWLAEIKSPDQQSKLNSVLTIEVSYWIGLNDLASKGQWDWQVWPPTHFFYLLFLNKNIVLPGWQINDPSSGEDLAIFLPSSNSLVLVSSP